MHRCFALSAAVLIGIGLCCGCGSETRRSSANFDATIAVTPASVSQPQGPQLVHGNVTVKHSADAVIPFTLELPPGWTWTDGQAEKTIGPPLTVLVSVIARELPDDEQRERPAAAARRRLLEVGDERQSDELDAGAKIVVRDRRIIQVGDNDAVWDVVAFQVEGEIQPTRLEARCHLKLGKQEFTIDGSHIDSRSDRTAADFEKSQAEFLKIIQSFRLDRTEGTTPRL
jgi:hypothetical protein